MQLGFVQIDTTTQQPQGKPADRKNGQKAKAAFLLLLVPQGETLASHQPFTGIETHSYVLREYLRM